MRHDGGVSGYADHMERKNTAVTIRLPGPLRDLAGGRPEVEVSGPTVGAALDDLVARHPALRRHLRTETGGLRDYVNVYLNEDDVRFLAGEATGLSAGDAVTLVPSIAGG